MKSALEWNSELYQQGAGASVLEIAAIQEDALDGLRDRFACAALTGLLAGDPDIMSVLSVEAMSDCAYTLADAMLARRAAPTAPPSAQPQKEP